MLYEILTGEPPFIGDSPVAVAYQHVREDPIPPSQRHEGISADLDAVVLKALAKNPENRYQTAAEMRADLVRVHNGETPEAPKILTDAERSSLLASPAPVTRRPRAPIRCPASVRTTPTTTDRWFGQPLGHRGRGAGGADDRRRHRAINTFGGRTRDVQVPDVRDQASADAIAALQNRGFKTRTQQKPDSTVPPDHVIGTDPGANASVSAGDVITVNVSTGPEQREVPDVSSLSYAAAVKKLKAAGFSRFKQANSPSTPEMKDKVHRHQPAGQPDVGDHQRDHRHRRLGTRDQAGSRRRGPDRRRRAEEPHGLRLHQVHPGLSGQHPSGRRGDRHQSAREQTVPVDSVIEMQVSKGNQFVMPDVTGMFWTDAEPRLRALGWTGVLDKGPDVDAGGSQHNRVVYQSPPAGAGCNKDGIITLKFGQ